MAQKARIDAETLLGAAAVQGRADQVLLALTGRRPFQRDVVFAGEGGDPAIVIVGALAEHFSGEDGRAQEIAEERHDVPLVLEERQLAVKDDAVEGEVKELNPGAKKLKQGLHREMVPVRGEASTPHDSNRNPDALEPLAAINFKSLWLELGLQTARTE